MGDPGQGPPLPITATWKLASNVAMHPANEIGAMEPFGAISDGSVRPVVELRIKDDAAPLSRARTGYSRPATIARLNRRQEEQVRTSWVTQGVGVDIGGTGIKAALVDLDRGILVGARRTAATPRPATPEAVAEQAAELVLAIGSPVHVGFGFPGVVRRGVTETAANLHPDWIGLDACELFSHHLGGRPVAVMNDADAAGLAEMRHGAGKGHAGVAVMVTLGTGIGTAVFTEGRLVPNSEYGHLIIDGVEAERVASTRAKERHEQDWHQWSGHLSVFLRELDRLLWPDVFIIGGGISAEFHRFCASLDTSAPAVPAVLGNDAGIVGAAIAIRESGRPIAMDEGQRT